MTQSLSLFCLWDPDQSQPYYGDGDMAMSMFPTERACWLAQVEDVKMRLESWLEMGDDEIYPEFEPDSMIVAVTVYPDDHCSAEMEFDDRVFPGSWNKAKSLLAQTKQKGNANA
jgi:hypothetical protein